MDLRVRVLAAYDAGRRTGEVAEAFSVSSAWVWRLKQRRRVSGEIVARRPSGRRHTLAGREDELRESVRRESDLTLEERRVTLKLPGSMMVLWRELHRLGLVPKKRRLSPPNVSDQACRTVADTGLFVAADSEPNGWFS